MTDPQALVTNGSLYVALQKLKPNVCEDEAMQIVCFVFLKEFLIGEINEHILFVYCISVQ